MAAGMVGDRQHRPQAPPCSGHPRSPLPWKPSSVRGDGSQAKEHRLDSEALSDRAPSNLGFSHLWLFLGMKKT